MELPSTMLAMVLEKPLQPLVMKALPVPLPEANQILIKVIACGVCRTDLHIADGELNQPKLPLIMGHEIVGTVVKTGDAVIGFNEGEIVGVPWLGYTCGACKYCLSGKENLCEKALFTGYTLDGGYAEFTVAYGKYCFRLNRKYANANGAPLLCAGLIGYRAYSMIENDAKAIGIYGFGAAAHLITQLAIYQKKEIYAFTRTGDTPAQQFALKLGAVWAGDSSEPSPKKLDAAIIFAPIGELIPKALQDVDKGGRVICGDIHMSDIPSFPYSILWEERSIRSVANLTRKDGEEFLRLASLAVIHTEVKMFPLEEANQALQELREGAFTGPAALVMGKL